VGALKLSSKKPSDYIGESGDRLRHRRTNDISEAPQSSSVHAAHRQLQTDGHQNESRLSDFAQSL
jgi:hypothetical protein